MSELNITLEHQAPVTPSLNQTNNNRFNLSETDNASSSTTRHPVNFSNSSNAGSTKLRPAISSGSVHKLTAQSYVQDDMVLLNNTRSSVFNPTMSAARSVNDLDQLPASSQHHLAQHTLPAYRAAPDYETAIRNKLGISPQQLWQNNPKFITDMVSNGAYPADQDHFIQQQLPASSIYSTSTPELNRINMTYHHHPQQQQQTPMYPMPTQDQIFAELQRLNLYKPPPPYPGTTSINNVNGQHQHASNGIENRMISSTSTPDLASSNNIMSTTMNASHSGVLLGGSSPDLVSRKNLGRVVAATNNDTTLHKTMDNLHNLIVEQQIAVVQQEEAEQVVGGFSKQVSF